ncbi:MAG: sigma-70 family RNA polymerase sigma factor, partial [Treponema sp.]|nr:sigma-70 family RNA polymerase sigma factor [Treponema sp.]
YGNMTSREIGKCLDISPGNVRIILKRSLAMLKSKLS